MKIRLISKLNFGIWCKTTCLGRRTGRTVNYNSISYVACKPYCWIVISVLCYTADKMPISITHECNTNKRKKKEKKKLKRKSEQEIDGRTAATVYNSDIFNALKANFYVLLFMLSLGLSFLFPYNSLSRSLFRCVFLLFFVSRQKIVKWACWKQND